MKTHPGLWLDTVRVLLLALCYFVAGELSFSLAVSHHIVTLVVFAAEGFSLAAAILWGVRMVPGVFLGQLLLALNNGLASELALGIAVVNSCEAALGAVLCRYFRLHPDLARIRDVGILLALIFLVLQPFSASFGTLLLWGGGVVAQNAFENVWFSWWLGNALGQVLITPALLTFFHRSDALKPHFYQALLAVLVATPLSLLILSQHYGSIGLAFALSTPALMVIAIYLGMSASTLATVIFTGMALWFTKNMQGVFFHDGQALILDLNVFLLGIALSGQLIAAFLNERRQLEHTLKMSEQRFIDMVNTVDGIVWEADAETIDFTFVSHQAERLLGYPASDWYQSGFWLAHLHPEDRQWVPDYCKVHSRKLRPYDFEYRFIAQDGRVVWLRDIISVLAENGKPRWLRGVMVDVSKQKHIEETLRISELRFRSTFEYAPVGVANVAPDGRFLAVNQRYCDMLGYSREQLLSMTVEQVTHPACQAAGKQLMLQALAGGRDAFTLEKRYVCSNGRIIWGMLSVKLFQHPESGLRYFIATVEDISQRKRVEDKLRASEMRLRRIINSSPVPMALHDNQRNIILLNSAFSKTLGYTLKDIPTLDDWWSKAYPDKAYRLQATRIWDERIGAAKQEASDFMPMELSICCKNGEFKTVILTASAIDQDFNGDFLVVLYDISERKRNEARIQLCQAYGGIGIWEANLRTGEQIWSDEVFTLLGFPRINQPCWDDFLAIIHPEDRARVQMTSQQHLISDMPYDVEYRIIDSAQQVRWIRSVGRAEFNVNGEAIYFRGIGQDISERKQMELDLKRSNTELEQFAYAVSHDMRQPLRMISSYLALLEKNMAAKLDDDSRQFLDFALDGAKRMDAMILAILDFSRVGRKTEFMSWLDMRQIVDEALGFLTPEINSSGGRVTIQGEWISLLASRDEMLRLFQNLIGNALKYCRADVAPEVEVSAYIKNNCFHVRVADKGIGIDPGQSERLFKVFSRLHPTSRYEGSGVGLALCRKIVEHHAGKIWVESEGEGLGCVFEFCLPIKNQKEDR